MKHFGVMDWFAAFRCTKLWLKWKKAMTICQSCCLAEQKTYKLCVVDRVAAFCCTKLWWCFVGVSQLGKIISTKGFPLTKIGDSSPCWCVPYDQSETWSHLHGKSSPSSPYIATHHFRHISMQVLKFLPHLLTCRQVDLWQWRAVARQLVKMQLNCDRWGRWGLKELRYLQLRNMIWVGEWKLTGISCILENGIKGLTRIFRHDSWRGQGYWAADYKTSSREEGTDQAKQTWRRNGTCWLFALDSVLAHVKVPANRRFWFQTNLPQLSS